MLFAVQMELKDVLSGTKVPMRFRPGEKVEREHKKTMPHEC